MIELKFETQVQVVVRCSAAEEQRVDRALREHGWHITMVGPASFGASDVKFFAFKSPAEGEDAVGALRAALEEAE